MISPMGMSKEYQRAHRDVVKARGPAKNYVCVECEIAATEWAYQHTGNPELVSPEGLLYANDPNCYAPMCKTCHARLDFAKAQDKDTRIERLVTSDRTRFKDGVTEKHANAARANQKKAIAAIDRKNPKFLEAMRKAGKKVSSVRRTCSCGMESTRSAIGSHQKATGHSGYSDSMERYGK